MRIKALVACAAVAVTVVLSAARVETQSGFQDVAPALLAEVRLLRTTIAAVAAAGATGQLILGRLQLQEARVDKAAFRLEATREQLSQMQRDMDDARRQCAQLEAVLNTPLGNRTEFIGLATAEIPEVLKARRDDLLRSANEAQRLTAVEAAQAADLAAEQGRWSELNQRLEEIERILRRGA